MTNYYPNVIEAGNKIICEFALKKEGVVVEKQVKSGARKLIQYLGEHFKGCNNLAIHHYCTSLKRKDITPQLKEYEAKGIKVHLLTRSTVAALKTLLNKEIASGYQPIIHYDESDYGTGVNQVYSELHTYLISIINKVKIIFYSATNSEIMFSDMFRDELDMAHIIFNPGVGFIGANEMLEMDRVRDARPFFEIDSNKLLSLSPQGHEALSLLKNDDTNIVGIVRLCAGLKESASEHYETKGKRPKKHKTFFIFKENKNDIIDEIAKKYGVVTKFIYSKEPFDWSRTSGDFYSLVGRYGEAKEKTLIVINQTCTRSTEISFLDKLGFYHDFRNADTTRDTRVQAFYRTNHYLGQYGSKKPNFISYTSIADYKLSAGQSDWEEYYNTTLVQRRSLRVNTIRSRNQYLYESMFFSSDSKDVTLKERGGFALNFNGNKFDCILNTTSGREGLNRRNGVVIGKNDPLLPIMKGKIRNTTSENASIERRNHLRSFGIHAMDSYVIDGSPKSSEVWGKFLDFLKVQTTSGSDGGKNVYREFMRTGKVYWVCFARRDLSFNGVITEKTNSKSTFNNPKKNIPVEVQMEITND